MQDQIMPQINPINSKPPRSRKNIKKITIVVVVLFVTIFLGWLVIKLLFGSGLVSIKETSTAQEFDLVIDQSLKIDKDLDGLLDSEEKTYKTSVASPDTDGDGLTDYAEIKTYQTNPLVSDTDGDGVGDGIEVRKGTDPQKR